MTTAQRITMMIFLTAFMFVLPEMTNEAFRLLVLAPLESVRV